MIIGLVGKNCAGKGEVADFLKGIGYTYLSLSDEVRESLKQKGVPLTRDKLIEEGRALRRQFGDSVLADRIRKRIKRHQNYVVDSIRNPGEVASLRQDKEFFLVAVQATDRLRFDRMVSRDREGDPKTFEAFLEVEAKESDSSDSAAQQVDQTEALADVRVSNNGALDELHADLRDLLKDLAKKNSRPNWDDYFMEIARSVASRSNCIKRKVAAVIVKDKRVISTGYNGTPRGIQNCNEGGCARCNSFGAAGKDLTECLCSHAEENAIVQAAYHGVAINGATIYTTFSPCLLCTKMIINAGVAEVVYSVAYTMDDRALGLLQEAGVHLRQIQETSG